MEFHSRAICSGPAATAAAAGCLASAGSGGHGWLRQCCRRRGGAGGAGGTGGDGGSGGLFGVGGVRRARVASAVLPAARRRVSSATARQAITGPHPRRRSPANRFPNAKEKRLRRTPDRFIGNRTTSHHRPPSAPTFTSQQISERERKTSALVRPQWHPTNSGIRVPVTGPALANPRLSGRRRSGVTPAGATPMAPDQQWDTRAGNRPCPGEPPPFWAPSKRPAAASAAPRAGTGTGINTVGFDRLRFDPVRLCRAVLLGRRRHQRPHARAPVPASTPSGSTASGLIQYAYAGC